MELEEKEVQVKIKEGNKKQRKEIKTKPERK